MSILILHFLEIQVNYKLVSILHTLQYLHLRKTS